MNTLDIAQNIDRMSRNCSAHRPSAAIVELAAGWLRHGGTGAADENPSMARNRISWLGLSSPPSSESIAAMLKHLRDLHCGSVFLWATDSTLTGEVRSLLTASGAKAWPWVRYLAFTRSVEIPVSPVPCPFTIRSVSADEIAPVYQSCAPWYSDAGAKDATALVQAGVAECFAAFDGPNPIAISLLILEGPMAYLGWAGTNPAFRNRGAQSALIAARLQRAAEREATLCVSETNTVVEASLKNLLKQEFAPAAEWRVFAWTDGVS